MKKIVLLIVVTLFYVSNLTAQFKLNDFIVIKKEKLNNKTKIIKKLPRDLNASKADLFILKNNLKLIATTEKDFKKYYVYNDKKLTGPFYVKIIKDKEIQVYNKNKVLLYKIINDKGKGKIVLPQSNNKNPFKDCMDDAEEAVVDGLLGWVAWNYSPGVQLATAIYCATR